MLNYIRTIGKLVKIEQVRRIRNNELSKMFVIIVRSLLQIDVAHRRLGLTKQVMFISNSFLMRSSGVVTPILTFTSAIILLMFEN